MLFLVICGTLISANLLTQVGLRGNTSSDFNARTTATDWSSSSAASVNTGCAGIQPGSGYRLMATYSWVPCVSVPASAGTLFGASSVCAGSSNTYTLAPVNRGRQLCLVFFRYRRQFQQPDLHTVKYPKLFYGAHGWYADGYPQNACETAHQQPWASRSIHYR